MSDLCQHCGQPVELAHCVFFVDGKEYQGSQALVEEIERLTAELATVEAEREAAVNEGVGYLDERDSYREALEALYGAEWMVTHDWGGDREAVLEQARTALENRDE